MKYNVFTSLALLPALLFAACSDNSSDAGTDGQGGANIAEFDFSISRVTSDAVQGTVTPNNAEQTYVFGVINYLDFIMELGGRNYAALVDDYLDQTAEDVAGGRTRWTDEVKTGKKMVNFSGFLSSTEYMLFAAYVDFDGTNKPVRKSSNVTVYRFETDYAEPDQTMPRSSLDAGDHTFEFDGAKLTYYRDGKYWAEKHGVTTWILELSNSRGGDTCLVEFYTDAAAEYEPTGTYTVNDLFVKDSEYVPDTFSRGYLQTQGSSILNYWGSYYLKIDDVGRVAEAATLDGGTMTVTKEGDEYTFKGEFLDCKSNPSTLNFTFTAALTIVEGDDSN